MRKSKALWLLLPALLTAALLASCATAVEEPVPSPPPNVQQPPAPQTQIRMPMCQPEAESPVPEQPPVETTPAEEKTSPDLSGLIYENPADVDNSNLPITLVEDLGITGDAPSVDIAAYRLTVDGLVESPLALTYDDILAYPAVTDAVLLICPFAFADNAEWTGVPLKTLLAEAGPKPGASRVTFYSVDGYIQELSLEDAQRDGVFLAHTVNGQVLPPEHGYPLRLVVDGWYGAFWVKWLERIEVR